jgi:hypothetical protein
MSVKLPMYAEDRAVIGSQRRFSMTMGLISALSQIDQYFAKQKICIVFQKQLTVQNPLQ